MAVKTSQPLKVLIVDDQEDVRRCLSDLLHALGHRVETVSGSVEALAVIEADPGAFDCMITDVDLPILTGSELAERAAALHPGLRIVMMSGHQRMDLEAEGAVRPDQAFLPKPFRLGDLQAVIDVVREWRSIA